MRIHSNVISSLDLEHARRDASGIGDGAVFLEHVMHTSRSHARAHEVHVTGDGTTTRRRAAGGYAIRDERSARNYAATWCAWGAFLAHLFDIDPDMVAGPYRGRDDFDAQTGGLFADGARPRGQRPARV